MPLHTPNPPKGTPFRAAPVVRRPFFYAAATPFDPTPYGQPTMAVATIPMPVRPKNNKRGLCNA